MAIDKEIFMCGGDFYENYLVYIVIWKMYNFFKVWVFGTLLWIIVKLLQNLAELGYFL